MSFVSRTLTKNITLLKSKWDISITSSAPVGVLFMPFLGSKPKHHKPYLNLYEDVFRNLGRPLDVLVVQANVLDFLSVSRGKVLSSDVSEAINDHLCTYNHPTSKIIAHGMSVGNFIHAVNLKHDTNHSYQRRIAGQIFDSPVYGGSIHSGGLERIVEGIVETTLSNSKIRSAILRRLLTKAACSAVKPNANVFDDYITSFVTQSVNAPILTFYSSNDVMLDSKKYDLVVKEWKEKGANVNAFCFDNSVHAQHIIRHPEAFKDNFTKFLSSLDL